MKKRKKYSSAVIIYYSLVFFRIVTPLFIFIYPIFSVILTIFLDIIDGEFASKGVLTIKKYQFYDKALDFWGYIFQFIYSYFFLKSYFLPLLFLFVFRLIGQLIFSLTHKRKFLVFFPNFFESVFLVIFFAVNIKALAFLIEKQNLLTVSVIIIITKLFQEWWLHWAHMSVTEVITGKKKQWLRK